MYPVSERYPTAARAGGVQFTVVDAYYGGAPVATALAVAAGGTVTDTSRPGVRRTCDLNLLPRPGLFDLLSPIGTQLRVRSVLRYPQGVTEPVPMGVFDIDEESVGYGPGGQVTVAASDKWIKIQRARFLVPQASTAGARVTAQIAALIRGALGAGETVVVTATSTATVGSLVWGGDSTSDGRDTAILDLAESIGAWVYFDRDGVATIADLPATPARAAAWLVDAGASGVLLDGNRKRDRSKAYNVVVVNPTRTDGIAPFDPQIVWDDVPSSPTYAGTNPLTAPETAGPFGIVPYLYSSPLLLGADQALAAGRTILARVIGLAAQLELTAIRNHALDALDPIDVLLPQERYDIPRPLERHLIDNLVHPLDPAGVQKLSTRSTRTDTT